MIGGTRSYIIFNYLKYILINIIIFIGLIWLSQIIRILELQQSITTQLFEIIKTTIISITKFYKSFNAIFINYYQVFF